MEPSPNLKKRWLIVLAIGVGGFRPLLLLHTFNPHVKSGYEAVAHILVGVLIGGWLSCCDEDCPPAPWVSRTLWSLLAVELVCAAVTIARNLGG